MTNPQTAGKGRLITATTYDGTPVLAYYGHPFRFTNREEAAERLAQLLAVGHKVSLYTPAGFAGFFIKVEQS